MKSATKTIITIALLAIFGGAAYFAFTEGGRDQLASRTGIQLTPPQVVELSGLISLDVEPYFKDPRVLKILADRGITPRVTRIGSREMAERVVPGQTPDFFFPSGVVAANQIGDAARKANVGATIYSPFYTPMVIASWTPIGQVLAANGLAKEVQPKVWEVDAAGLVNLMLEKKRWRDLKGAQAYDVSKSVLVSTTDVRKSNSAAMYLALASYAVNGGDLVTDQATAQKVARKVSELFKRQGYQENYVNGNFDDYASIGIGKTPMAWIYENQLVAYALARKGIGADMMIMYPRPTIFNKVVYLATSERAKKLGELLGSDAQLQQIAVEYGFRIADSTQFVKAAQGAGLAVEERISQVIDPPSYEVMAGMIDVITREMGQ
ncbi:MAG: hypothetical protein EOO28_22670 [Comamonadaceae bacterium]|nr:MAG: hypothetical protein EOO28_22670 [Comamonadaceae bacterium]